MLYLSMKLFLIMFNASNASSLCWNTLGQRCIVSTFRKFKSYLQNYQAYLTQNVLPVPPKRRKRRRRRAGMWTSQRSATTFERCDASSSLNKSKYFSFIPKKKTMYTVTCHWHVSSMLRKAMYIVTLYRHSRKLKYVSFKEHFKTTMCIQQTVIQFIKWRRKNNWMNRKIE
jgi:hypothetical protein